VDGSLNIFALTLFFAGAFLAMYGIRFLVDKKRMAAIQALAPELGLQYRHEGDPFEPDPTPEVALFHKGRDQSFRHLLNGWVAGMQAAIFDYQFRVGTGKNAHDLKQTVAAYKLQHALAAFEISPANWRSKLTSLFADRDIHFVDHPEFSRRYRLRGRDELSLRSFFTPALLQVFEDLPPNNWSIQTSEGWVILFRERHRVAPAAMADFIRETSNIAAGLKQF
jgi:hypothetical protein